MRAISLLYHDVVLPGHFEASGFPGADAAIYKLDLPDFQEHIRAIASGTGTAPTTVHDIGKALNYPFLLTFDDGGCSAHEYIADVLGELQWRAHFFVTADWIGRRGFLTSAQIRNLHARGHVIGSHSCSHPPRMSYCTREQLSREWKDSIATLTDIVGEKVDTASVPGGYHSRQVAEEAAEAGIRALFTSEPRIREQFVNGCVVLGRYTIQRGVKPSVAAAIATRRILPRYSQFAYWNLKKTVKAIGGNRWLEARKWILAR
jgi:peptidoglycan/xylan/chitin deacetylase (PgdA/CDA1 family)